MHLVSSHMPWALLYILHINSPESTTNQANHRPFPFMQFILFNPLNRWQNVLLRLHNWFNGELFSDYFLDTSQCFRDERMHSRGFRQTQKWKSAYTTAYTTRDTFTNISIFHTNPVCVKQINKPSLNICVSVGQDKPELLLNWPTFTFCPWLKWECSRTGGMSIDSVNKPKQGSLLLSSNTV